MATRRMGLLIPTADDNCQNIMRGVVRYVQKHGGWEIDTREAVPMLPWPALDRWQGDGLVAMVYFSDQCEALRNKGIPAVNTCARIDTRRLPTVWSDNPAIGRVAAEHLMGLGLKRFAFVGRQDLLHDQQRGAGFIEVVTGHGMACRRIDVGPTEGGWHDAHDMSHIANELGDLDRPVGIFTAHDNLGCEVLTVCRRLGVQVPHEMAVVGVNNFELLCETIQPPLTSISQQGERTGFEAARLLTRILDGEVDDVEHLRLPPGELIERRSTDFLAVDDPDVAWAMRFIRDNAAEPITVDDVLRHVAVSRRTLDKRFIEAIGHVPAQEIRLTRLRRAQNLLANTRERIVSVAMQSGFRSASGFDRAFREHTGMTPRQYRRRFSTEW